MTHHQARNTASLRQFNLTNYKTPTSMTREEINLRLLQRQQQTLDGPNPFSEHPALDRDTRAQAIARRTRHNASGVPPRYPVGRNRTSESVPYSTAPGSAYGGHGDLEDSLHLDRYGGTGLRSELSRTGDSRPLSFAEMSVADRIRLSDITLDFDEGDADDKGRIEKGIDIVIKPVYWLARLTIPLVEQDKWDWRLALVWPVIFFPFVFFAFGAFSLPLVPYLSYRSWSPSASLCQHLCTISCA